MCSVVQGERDAAACPWARKDATHGCVNVGGPLLSQIGTCNQRLQLALCCSRLSSSKTILQVEVQVKLGLGLWGTNRKAAGMIQMGIL